MYDDRPIGVFDSGVGGLSVLAEIARILANESVLYVADQAWAPYGERDLAEVRERSVAVATGLIERGAKAVVIACNSASAAALHHLRELFPETPFIGMEPAVKPAALESSTGIVGVIATRATFQGELFASVVDRHANGVVVLTEPVPMLVRWVESGEDDGSGREELESTLARLTDRGADVIVLGCTHFPFLVDEIREVVGPEVRLVDPARAVARQAARVLDAGSRMAPPDRIGGVAYHSSGSPEHLAAAVQRLLGVPAPEVLAW